MQPTLLTQYFERIGARLKVADNRRLRKPYDIDIRQDAKGEHFALSLGAARPDFQILQANRAARHLLLYAVTDAGRERFLCGHDERHWFVASIASPVSTITDAKRSLLPSTLRDLGLTADQLARRHTDAFKRQGEWFFIPSDKDLSRYPIHRSEPLQRGARNKPHLVSELIRFGGTQVVLCNGKEYSPEEWDVAVKADRMIAHGRNVRRAVKDAEVYVRGRVRHADHATLVLKSWHRVYMNLEVLSENMSFYD